jgi:hypothetical protein
MKKPLLIVVIILAVILALPVINLLRWTFQTKKPMGIIIVDKTVPSIDREKHKSFNWIITNDRFVKKENKTSYSESKDYFGFIPKRPLKERQYDKNDYRISEILGDPSRNITGLSKKNDAVYFTDTYGVFFNDWYQGINRSRRSKILYGGLNGNDNVLLKTMQDSNKLIILEYNTLDYPTNDLVSFQVQEKLGITFSKWTGKYFSSLDTTREDFPIWMTAMYRKQYKKPWTFNKQGIVLLRDKYILVLEEGTHLKNPMPYIITDSAYCTKYNIAESVAFDQWFDIINPLENNVISKFRIETTSLADSLLSNYGLSNEFPAVILEPLKQRTYYFSGDFCYTNIPSWTSRFMGVDKMKGFLYSKKPEDTRRFFWLYYKPLIESIFNDYFNSMSAK